MRIDNIKVTGSIANSGSLATLSGSFSGSFAGNGENITGVISSSFATTASLALQAESASTAESATSASYIQAENIDGDITASAIDFDNITNKPVLYSGSTQLVDALDGQDLSLGVVSASILHEIYTTQSINLGSGSFQFGDTLDDTHTFTGSVDITGSLTVIGNIDSVGRINTDDSMRSVFVGRDAGEKESPGFLYNTGIGYAALGEISTGPRNTGLGFQSQGFITTGADNIGIGYFAGLGVVTGVQNIFIGTEAGGGNFSEGGSRQANVGIGHNALRLTSTANNNTAVGALAGRNITTGGLNAFFGWRAGGSATTGISNVALGANAGWANMDGDNNILIGYNTATSQSSDNNTIVIGASEIGRGSNTTTIGNNNITSTRIYGTLEIDGITDVSASIASLEDFSSSLDDTFVTDSDLQNLIDKTGSYATTSSVNELIDKTGSYATTGSNTFTGNQTINAATLEIDNTGDAQIILDRGANANDAEIVFQTNNTLDWTIGTGQVGGDADFTIRHQNNNNIFRLSGTGLNINTSVSASEFSGSFRGNGSQLTGLVSASHAETASYADKIKVDFVDDDFEYGLMLVSNPQENRIQIGTTDQTTGDLTYNPLTRTLNVSGALSASDAYFVDSITLLTAMDLDLTAQDTGDGHLTASNVLVRGDIEILGSVTASNLDATASKALSVQNSNLIGGVNIPLLYGNPDPSDPIFSYVTSDSDIYHRDGETFFTSITTTGSITSTGSIIITDGRLEGVDAQISGAFNSTSASISTDLTTAIANVSGAFQSDSASFSSSIASLETFSSSLDASYSTEAELNAATQSLSQSIASTIEDVIDGTITVTSASYAITSSYTLNALTASNADTASYVHVDNIDGEITADSIHFDNITNKPTLYSGSSQLVEALDGQDLSLGVVSASILHEIYTTQSINLGSGSFLFGDTVDDTHTFIGSVQITGSLDITGNIDSVGQIYQDRNERETFIGYNAGINARSETYNVGIGYQVLENLTSGSRNVAIGFESLEELIEGDYNIGLGFRAGRGITNGNHNTYLGVLAGSDTTGGTRRDNTGIGYRSGEATTTGDFNTTVGSLAGYQMTTGDQNTFVGWRAGGALTTGNRNVAFGANADWVVMNGDDNTVLGYNTRLLQTNDSHSIVIGSGVVGRGDGTTTIGSTNTTSTRLYGSLEIDGITDVSASIASLEGFSASLDATYVTEVELNAATQSLSSSIATDLTTIIANVSGAFASDSASIATNISASDARLDVLDGLNLVSGSNDTVVINNITASNFYTDGFYYGDGRHLTGVSASLIQNGLLFGDGLLGGTYTGILDVTSSIDTSSAHFLEPINEATQSLSQSFATALTLTQNAVDNIETFTGSIESEVNAIQTFTSSIQSEVDALQAVTGGYAITSSISGAFDSVSSSIATDLTTAIANVSGAFDSISSSLSASIATNVVDISANATAITTLNGAGLLSSSFQISDDISGSFTQLSASLEQRLTIQETNIGIDSASLAQTASFVTGSNVVGTVNSSSHAITASYALNALTASYAISSSHEIIQEITSSYAETASYALRAEVEITKEVSSSNADTASYVEFSNIDNLPTLLSSSTQIASDISGAFVSPDTVATASSLHGSQIRINATGSHGIDTVRVESGGGFHLSVADSSAIRIGDTTTNNSSIAINGTSGVHLNTNNTVGAELQVSAEAITDGTDDSPNILAVGTDGRLQTSNITIPSNSLPAGILSSSAQIATEISGAFTTDSASFSSSIASLETFSSSLDATFATEAELNAATQSLSQSIASTIEDVIDGTITVTSASYALSASHVIGLDVETSSYATTSSYTHTSSLAQRLELENVDTTDQQFTFALVNTESRSVVSYDTNDLLFNPSSGELEITGLTVTNFTISGSNIGQGTIQDALTASLAVDAITATSAETASLADEIVITTMPAMVDTYYPTLTTATSDRGIVIATSSIYYDRPNETLYVPNFSGSFEGDGSGITGITADSVTFANVTNKPTLISSSNQLDGFVSQSADFVANEFIVANGANSVTSSNLLSVDMTEQRIGIGTTSPTVKLDIVGETGGEAQMRLAQHDNSSDGPDMRFFKSRGTEDSPAAVNADDYIGAVNAFSYDGSNYQQSGFFGFQSLGTGGEANFSIKTRLDGAFPDRLTIDGEGDVHISGDLYAPTITGSLFRLSENGQGMRLTNVGGFENYSGTFNIFSNNDVFLRAGGASDSFAVATLHQSNQRAEFHGQVSASLFSGSFVGDGSGLTGLTADSIDFDNVTNKPTLLSGSAQITDLTTYTENVSGDTSYDIDHNLNERYPIVQAWNTTNHNMEIPATVVSNTVNQVTITFGAEFAGRIIVKK